MTDERVDTERQTETRNTSKMPDFDELREPVIGPLSMQMVALTAAALFLVIGILGFVPGVTTGVSLRDGLQLSGKHSHAMLFGLFMVSTLHNFVHLAYAVFGAIASFLVGTVRLYFLTGGVVYLALWIYGLSVSQGSNANFLPFDTADNWLHFGLGVVMVAVAIVLHLRLQSVRRANRAAT